MYTFISLALARLDQCWLRSWRLCRESRGPRTLTCSVGPTQADLCRGFSCRAVGPKLSFFEAAYTTRVSPAELGTAAEISGTWKICEGARGPFAELMVRIRLPPPSSLPKASRQSRGLRTPEPIVGAISDMFFTFSKANSIPNFAKRKFKLLPGMSYQVSDDGDAPHRSSTQTSTKLIIVD
jgi:hypothetical protein